MIPTLVVGGCFNYRREDILLVAMREKNSQRKHVLMRSMKELLGISVYFNIYEQGRFVCSSMYHARLILGNYNCLMLLHGIVW